MTAHANGAPRTVLLQWRIDARPRRVLAGLPGRYTSAHMRTRFARHFCRSR